MWRSKWSILHRSLVGPEWMKTQIIALAGERSLPNMLMPPGTPDSASIPCRHTRILEFHILGRSN